MLINDAQLGHLDHSPFMAWPVYPLAFAGVWILYPLRAVPDIGAGVQLVVDHARAFQGVAVQRRHGPRVAARGWHALGVELVDDVPVWVTVGRALEDPAHPVGLLFIDNVPAAGLVFNDVVAVGLAAGDVAPVNLAMHAALGLVA
ncbi:hypothetical protein ASB58_10920 [Pseudomonas abyssi]|uniref:Uncharacterized protein n=1 Tax=Pseudomonas abyssi TaxID=170540 RepID=A0A395R2Q1_9PSED|nr:hypothetical protein ASB58_10920 [Halopseudomonas gallaeciensis]